MRPAIGGVATGQMRHQQRLPALRACARELDDDCQRGMCVGGHDAVLSDAEMRARPGYRPCQYIEYRPTSRAQRVHGRKLVGT